MASLTVYSSPGYQGYLRLNQDIEIRLFPYPSAINYGRGLKMNIMLWLPSEDADLTPVSDDRRMPSEVDVLPNPGVENRSPLCKPQSALWTIAPPPPPIISYFEFRGGGGGETMKSLGRLWCRPRGSKPPASQWDGNDCNELPGLLCLRGFHNETTVAAVLAA